MAQAEPPVGVLVVVCLLPGLRRVVRRFGLSLGREEAWAELVAVLWERIIAYDLGRRPRRIAANLLWDSAAGLLRRVRAEDTWRAHRSPAMADLTCDGDLVLSATTLWELATEAGVVAPLDVALIEATRGAGLSLGEASRLVGIGYEAARKRRQRAEAAWVSWWAPERLATATAGGAALRRRAA